MHLQSQRATKAVTYAKSKWSQNEIREVGVQKITIVRISNKNARNGDRVLVLDAVHTVL